MPQATFVINAAAVQFDGGGRLARIPVARAGRWMSGDQLQRLVSIADMRSMADKFNGRNHPLMIDFDPKVAVTGSSESLPPLVPENVLHQPAGPRLFSQAGVLRKIGRNPDSDGVFWGTADLISEVRELRDRGYYRYFESSIDWKFDKSLSPVDPTLTSMYLSNNETLAKRARDLDQIGFPGLEWQPEKGGEMQMQSSGRRSSGYTLAELDELYDGQVNAQLQRFSEMTYERAAERVAMENPTLIRARESLREEGLRLDDRPTPDEIEAGERLARRVIEIHNSLKGR
jgi:hypothetical protein